MPLFELLGKSEKEFFIDSTIDSFGDYEKDSYDDSYYIIFKSEGLSFLFDLDDKDDFYLHSIFIDECSYVDANIDLIVGIKLLDFSCDSQKTLELFGQPDSEGGGGQGLLGEVPRWSKYKYSKFYVHLQFSSQSNLVEKITLTCS